MHKCLPRDATHSAVFAVVRCPSVCHVDVSKRPILLGYQTFTSPGGPIILVFQKGKTVKFRRGHPQQGRQIEVGYTENLRFSTSISEIPIPIPNTEPTWKKYRRKYRIPIPTPNTDTDPALIPYIDYRMSVMCHWFSGVHSERSEHCANIRITLTSWTGRLVVRRLVACRWRPTVLLSTAHGWANLSPMLSTMVERADTAIRWIN